MGCAESTEHGDDLDHSLNGNTIPNTVDIDTSRMMTGTPRAAGKPIGFSRVAEARLKRQQQEEAESRLDRDTIPPLSPAERAANKVSHGPSAIAPPNPLNVRSRPLILDADSSVSPIQSGTSVFSDGPPAADQRTVAPMSDDVMSLTSLTSSAPVMSSNNSHSGAPEFSSNVGTSCVAEDVPSPSPSIFP